MVDDGHVVSYDELGSVDLHVDRVYAGKALNGRGVDPMSRLFGVGVQGGIRFKGSAINNSVRLVVLYSTGEDPDWRDQLDSQTGILTYYGDNKQPGGNLLQTHLRGNVALRNAFLASRGSYQERRSVSPFFYFERVQREGSLVRFRGLAAPGAEALTSSEELAALWWSKGGQRFQNYCARFTILDAPAISHEWIDALVAGESPLSDGCPDAWREWVDKRTYRALIAPSTDLVRKQEKQLPTDAVGAEILAALKSHFETRRDFREFALAVWRLLAPSTGGQGVMRGENFTHRYLSGEYLIGPPGDRVSVGFVLDADVRTTGSPITNVSRLFSRLRHREFGVFVTLSYFSDSVYDEVRADSHPVALVSGGDVVEILRREGFSDVASVKAWLDAKFPVETVAG